MLLAGRAVRRLSRHRRRTPRRCGARASGRQLRLSRATGTPFPEGVDLALLKGAGPLGLAVSGGGDSTALAVLLVEAGVPDLTILTVDHGLRADSAKDADFVAALAERLGLPFERLVVSEPAHGSVQAFARSARYRLLSGALRRRGLGAIVTAHTLEDQAETFLLRLARGSGLRGLSAIRPRAVFADGLTVLRPFLGTRRAALREALAARGVAWRDDPSNTDPKFDRIAIRQLMPRLSAIGLTPERLASTTLHLQRADEAIEGAVRALTDDAVRVDRAGGVVVSRDPFLAAAEDVRLRVLAHVIQLVGGAAYPPRFNALREAAELVARGNGRTTLGRAIVDISGGTVKLWRELRGIDAVSLTASSCLVWDGRYTLSASADAPPVTIAPLGQAAGRCPVQALPGAIAAAPAVFVGETLACAPTLGVRRRGWPRHYVTANRVR